MLRPPVVAASPGAVRVVCDVEPPFSYEPGTTGGEKKHTSSSGSGPSDSVACGVPGLTQTVTPGSISAAAVGGDDPAATRGTVDRLLLAVVDVAGRS